MQTKSYTVLQNVNKEESRCISRCERTHFTDMYYCKNERHTTANANTDILRKGYTTCNLKISLLLMINKLYIL